MKSIKPEEFFKLIAVNSGVSDLDTVKDIYYGMVRTISRELKEKHLVKLPDWGEFSLRIYKSRKIMDVNRRVPVILPAQPFIKFVSDYKVKKYFYELGKDSTVL